MTPTQHALVTGASSGIGWEFAKQLAANGYRVTCVARRKEKLRQLVDELSGDGHCLIVADLATTEGLAQVSKAFTEQHFNLLVNNAGYSVIEPFYQSDLATQNKIFAVNCSAVVTLAHAFLQQAHSGDALINVASVVAYLPTPAQPMYSASKAFIAALSECLWDEQRARGVFVMGLCPGVTTSEFISTATGGESNGENLPSVLVQTSEQVVTQALQALSQRKKAIVVTGWINRLMLLMPRLLSRHRLIKALSIIGDPEHAL